MFQLPCAEELVTSKHILIAGCGGGYDFFSGIPLVENLKAQGRKVTLANLAFSDLSSLQNARLVSPMCYEITSKTTTGDPSYAPEIYLCQYYDQKQQDPGFSVFTFDHSISIAKLRVAYETIIKERDIDTIILVDGGTDSLMRGDEQGLGTPSEDMTSIGAVKSLKIKGLKKYLYCIGFGIDSFHGVHHSQFLENVSSIIKKHTGGFLGCFSLLREAPEFKIYKAASEFVYSKMSHHPSIVNLSIRDAIEGHFGNHHSTNRTVGSDLFINPLMGMYWCFTVDAVAAEVLYWDEIMNTNSRSELSSKIKKWREEQVQKKKIRPAKSLPM